MKHLLLFAALVYASTVNAQTESRKHMYSFSLYAGTDFDVPLSMLGLETGFYGINSKHSYLLTLEADRMANETLRKFERPEKIWQNSLSRISHEVSVKYLYRLRTFGPVEVHTIAQPFYSMNMNVVSGYAGGRVTFNGRRNRVSVEFVHDPFVSRHMFRLVATPKLKRKA